MNLTQVKADIKLNEYQKIYMFTGEEIGVMDIYIKQIVKNSGKSVFRADTFREAFERLTKDNFSNSSYVCIVRDDKDIQDVEKGKKAQIRLDNENWIKDNIIILVFTDIDKRTAFYKKYKDRFVEFERLDAAILRRHIQKKIALSDRYCDKLIEVCESDYSRILLEVDKLIMFCENRLESSGLTYDKVLCDLIEDGAIYRPPKDAIFDFVDAVMRRQPKKAFKLLQESYASGETTIPMLSVLYNNVKQTLQVQASGRSSKLTESTGLTGWQIQCAKKYIGNYDDKELVNAMHLLRDVERGIKLGRLEDRTAMDYVLINML